MKMKTRLAIIGWAGLLLAGSFITNSALAQGDGGAAGGGAAAGGGGAAAVQGGAANFGGGRGGGRGFANVASTSVTVAADDYNNALIISATDEQMKMIKELIAQLDRQMEDVSVLRVFRLENADPQDTVSQLATLFPDPTTLNRGGGNRGNTARAASFTTPDGQVVRLAKVLAVADLRTHSIIVSASDKMMGEVARVIAELDSDKSGQASVHAIALPDVDPAVAAQVIQTLFQSRSGIRQNIGNLGASTLNRNTTSRTGIGSGIGTGVGTGTGRTGGATRGGTGGTAFGGF
jgi:hypothetical protein